MKLTNAIKKLSKLTKVEQNGQQFWGVINGNVVEFMANGRIQEDTTICCIRVRGIKEEDDSMTDYFCGVWYRNLTAAIRSTQN